VSAYLAQPFQLWQHCTLTLFGIERGCWWFHIVGILGFLNYLPYSKHFHILLAFPNVWYSKLKPKTEMVNMPRVTGEVKSMLDPPSTADRRPRNRGRPGGPERFGAKDVFDLSLEEA
jgi:hypothetical protein